MSDYVPFSKREKQKLAAGKPRLFQYAEVPEQLRVQVVLLLKKAIGTVLRDDRPYSDGATLAFHAWNAIFERLREELGRFSLHEIGRDPYQQVCNFILSAERDEFLDAVELCLRVVIKIGDEHSQLRDLSGITSTPDEAIEAMNFRFRESGFGYRFVAEAGILIQVDSEFVHSEVIEPSFALLHDVEFSGAENEFQDAHKKYREGRYKDCLVDALKAFESTIKSICSQRGWSYAPNATAKDLIKIIFENKLIPDNQQSFFSALRALLESGLPTIRNKTSGHGQGGSVVVVPQYLAAYGLALSAASITLLVEANAA